MSETETFVAESKRRLAVMVERFRSEPFKSDAMHYADRHVFGGWAAYRQMLDVGLASARQGLAILEAMEQDERRDRAWARMEAEVDTSVLESLSWSTPVRADEDEGAYLGRLDEAAKAARFRLDPMKRPLASARARVEEPRSTGNPVTELPILRNASTVTEETEERNSDSSEPTEAELLRPSREALVEELRRLRAARGADVTVEETATLGSKRLRRRIEEERRRQRRGATRRVPTVEETEP